MRADGGQAFPSPSIKDDAGKILIAPETGMTVRDYFAAHAPDKPQPWFKPNVGDAPIQPASLPQDLTPEEKAEYEGWGDWINREDITCPRIRDYVETVEAYREAERVWSDEYDKQIFVQWPYAWADEQIRQRHRDDPVLTEKAEKP